MLQQSGGVDGDPVGTLASRKKVFVSIDGAVNHSEVCRRTKPSRNSNDVVFPSSVCRRRDESRVVHMLTLSTLSNHNNRGTHGTRARSVHILRTYLTALRKPLTFSCSITPRVDIFSKIDDKRALHIYVALSSRCLFNDFCHLACPSDPSDPRLIDMYRNLGKKMGDATGSPCSLSCPLTSS